VCRFPEKATGVKQQVGKMRNQMIIFGSRMYGRRDVVKGWGYCEHCGTYGKSTSYTGRKWGHLYFIPLIPAGPRVRVAKECKRCSHGMHIPETEVPALLNDTQQSSARALAALISGQETFDDEGTMRPCAAFLAGSIELLYCLCAEEYVSLILATLQERGLTHAYQLVNGESLEFQGKQEEAAASFRQAAESDPTDAHPLLSLGSIHLSRKDHEEAKSLYEKALGLSSDKFPVLQVLLAVYDSLKDHAKLAETYEQCFELMPELANDKKVLKAYKKACKKAGKPPEMEWQITSASPSDAQ